MSTELPTRPATVSDGSPPAYALVVSQYNSEFTTALATNATAELLAIDPAANVVRFDVPGAFEIPLAVDLLAAKRRFAAIIALGVIIRGATDHADLIAASITDALQRSAISHHTPVIHEVLLVTDADQARARCQAPDLNRGLEAARAAVSAAHTIRAILAA
jgi:6,7-dimethyl-8-ribityllumazine synthase